MLNGNSWKQFCNNIRIDVYRNHQCTVRRALPRILSSHTTIGLLTRYRFCNMLENRKLGLLGRIIRTIARWRYDVCQARCGIELPAQTRVGVGLRLPHRGGIVIHPNVIIGDNCEIAQCVTIGNNLTKSRYDVAKIGNNVVICTGTKIIGPITIGDDICIGANSIVNKSLPSHCICAGMPCRIIKQGENLFPIVNTDY